jgi:hypothetical protein
MKARFFYAAPVYKTWAKLFILTEDGRFYCKYLNYMQPATIELKFDYKTFKEEDYSWSGYQSIKEIDELTAKNTNLTQQENWVEKYLKSL